MKKKDRGQARLSSWGTPGSKVRATPAEVEKLHPMVLTWMFLLQHIQVHYTIQNAQNYNMEGNILQNKKVVKL